MENKKLELLNDRFEIIGEVLGRIAKIDRELNALTDKNVVSIPHQARYTLDVGVKVLKFKNAVQKLV